MVSHYNFQALCGIGILKFGTQKKRRTPSPQFGTLEGGKSTAGQHVFSAPQLIRRKCMSSDRSTFPRIRFNALSIHSAVNLSTSLNHSWALSLLILSLLLLLLLFLNFFYQLRIFLRPVETPSSQTSGNVSKERCWPSDLSSQPSEFTKQVRLPRAFFF